MAGLGERNELISSLFMFSIVLQHQIAAAFRARFRLEHAAQRKKEQEQRAI